MKAGIEQIPDSPASEAVRSFIKNFGKGGLEQFKEADFAYQHANDIPVKNEGENDQDFEKRINQFEKPLEEKEIAKGAVGQLSDTFNMAIAYAAPEMSPKAWATLGTFIVSDQTRQAVQRIFAPNMTPSEKDVLDLAAFPLEGGMSHEAVVGISDMISKAFTIKGLSPTIDMSPDFLKAVAEPMVTEKPEEARQLEMERFEGEGGALDRLGISKDHYDVSQSTGLPVRIPLSSVFNLTPDEVKQMITFEGEGGIINKEDNEDILPQEVLDANQRGESPIAPLRPESIEKVSSSPHRPTEGWESDVGSMPGEPTLIHKNGAVIERINEQGDVLYEAVNNEGQSLGIFPEVDIAKEAVEKSGGSNAESGRGSAQEGSNQEGAEGQAQTGVHLRDTSQGGLEAKAGEEVEKGTSKIAQSIEQKAKDAGLTTGFDKLSDFEKTTFKEQREKADKVINDNIDDARAMVRGEKPLPEGLKGISLIDGMERHLKTNPDPDIAEELANSKLVSETSTHAQETALAGMREPDSFTAKMNEINRANVEAAGGDKEVSKAIKKNLDTYKKESSKVNLSKDELNWDKFLEGIKC